MAIDQQHFERHFCELVDELLMMIDSGVLREDEIIRFRQCIDMLSDDVFDFEDKRKWSIEIEHIVHQYIEVMEMYGISYKNKQK